MNNNQLTYTKNNKISKKNIRLIIILIIGTILLITIVAYFSFIYNSPQNKLKRYLEKEEYTCKNNICLKETSQTEYAVNLKKGTFEISNYEHDFYLSETTKSLNLKKDKKVCYYSKDESPIFSNVDESYTYDLHCQKHLELVNEYINYFKNIFEISKVSVNELKK